MNVDSVSLPPKYKLLMDAKKQGILIPETLFVSEETLKKGTFENSLSSFLQKNKSPQYIVRSCVTGEDGTKESLAGHFESSGAISEKKIRSTIKELYQKNKDIVQSHLPKGKTNLMVQTFCPGDFGGVAFTPWKYYAHHFLTDVSTEGVTNAVEGGNSQTFCLSTNKDFEDLLPLPKEWNTLEKPLKEIIQKVQSLFSFPLDIEWVEYRGTLTILQIRPITRNIPALLQSIEAEQKQVEEELQAIHPGAWETSALTESFGNLSPLSASLFQKLYEDSEAHFQSIGFKGGKAFFKRIPNGQLVLNPELQKEFYSFRSFASPFSQAFKEPGIKQKIQSFCKSQTDETKFQYQNLLTIFQHWQTANTYFQLKQKGKITEPFTATPDEYEIGILQAGKNPEYKKTESWEALRNHLKALFLWELQKLKQRLKKTPEQVFLTWEEFTSLSNEEKRTKAQQCYQKHLQPRHLASYNSQFGNQTALSQKQTCIAGKDTITAPAFVVQDPATFREKIPSGVILVAPYFRNDWILQLDQISGVILEQGGMLSHSAIVAREKNIPYFIHTINATNEYKRNQTITISPKDNNIQT